MRKLAWDFYYFAKRIIFEGEKLLEHVWCIGTRMGVGIGIEVNHNIM